MDTENIINKSRYEFRSRSKNLKEQKNKKKYRKIKSSGIKHPVKTQNKIINVKRYPSKQNSKQGEYIELDMNNPKVSELFSAILLNKAFGGLKNNANKQGLIRDGDDDEYIPFRELPSDVLYLPNEEKYIKKLSDDERNRIFKIEKKVSNFQKNTIPQRFRILDLKNISLGSKAAILKKLDHLNSLSDTDNEYHKLSQWRDHLNQIPFDKFISPKCTSKSTVKKKIKFLNKSMDLMNSAIYGQDDAKEQIIRVLSQELMSNVLSGNSIAFRGPPGTGKTSLVKEGIAKALNRPFAFIPAGGMHGSEFLTGFDYTWEGGKPGRIIEVLQETKCMNPLIFIDELDKLAEGPKGEEIANVISQFTDKSQNKDFNDRFFPGVNIDLSGAMFIFSYNDESKISPILLDRLIKIDMKGFEKTEKLNIANDYLMPRICKDYSFDTNDVNIDDEVLTHIITNYTEEEEGVRNLKRSLETIISKLNVLKIMNDSKDMTSNSKLVRFTIKDFKLPIIIDIKLADYLISNGNKTEKSVSKSMMYL